PGAAQRLPVGAGTMDGMRQTTPAGNGETTSGPSLVTFGHGTADAGTMTRLLHGAGIRRLVDVRTAPGRRRNPGPARAALADRAGLSAFPWEPGQWTGCGRRRPRATARPRRDLRWSRSVMAPPTPGR